MPFVGGTPTQRAGLRAGREPAAWTNTHLHSTAGFGVPRLQDLLTTRLLEDTHAVQIPMRAILGQVAETEWSIRVKEGVTGSGRHDTAANEIMDWLDGGHNQNNDDFSHWVRSLTHDILSIDAGITELVADGGSVQGGGQWLSEMYVRDGATFTKELDEHGRLPPTGSPDPAYWQHGHNAMPTTTTGFDLHDILRDTSVTGVHGLGRPVPFTRDSLVWVEENPQPKRPYGLGRVTALNQVLAVILHGDTSNLKHLKHGELVGGALAYESITDGEVQRIREYWESEIAGNHKKVPILSGSPKWLPIQPTNQDLQFLDSQQWYHKLAWFMFGLGPSEVGDVSDTNLANGQEQAAATWRRVTRPTLRRIQKVVNNCILPFLPWYWDVDGELEFAWNFDNPAIRAIKQNEEKENLASGLATINEVRQARSQDPLPWGDMTPGMVQEVTRQHTRWAMMNWAGIPEDELPEEPLDFFSLDAPAPTRKTASWDLGSVEGILHAPVSVVKEALRNEAAAPFPAVKGIIDTAAKDLATELRRAGDDLVDLVKQRLNKNVSFDIGTIVSEVDVAPALRRIITAAGLAAMKAGGEHHARGLERELATRLPEGSPALGLEFRVEDTNAAKAMAARAARNMVTVNRTIQGLIRDTLVQAVQVNDGNVTDATRELRRLFDDQLTEAHARLVARTEVLQASRSGSQALAESTPLIAGKGWRATKDTRTRAWHRAMDGVVVAKDTPFTVPLVDAKAQRNRGYPKSAHVVGEDQPFQCRCDQFPVLADDLPTIRELASTPGVVRKEPPTWSPELTEKQRGVLFEHGEPGEDWKNCLARLLKEAGSKHALERSLGVPRSTIYSWLPEA